jgi:S-adenosylmethionine-diacylglycerol 3-amino-3-carboxypropyl transferase
MAAILDHPAVRVRPGQSVSMPRAFPPVIDLPTPGKRDWLERMVFSGIVFNMSWEDPEMDRRAFGITAEDTVLSITSAGCNPLNLLCQNPRRLIAIDSNPAQTALLELKLAGIAGLEHPDFFDIFAARNPGIAEDVYLGQLRPLLSPRSRAYWDRNIHLVAHDVYRAGRMGLFCRILRAYLRLLDLKAEEHDAFFDCRTLDEQRTWYREKIAPRLWRRTSRLFVYFKPLMYMAGVHPNQFRLVDGRHDMYQYVQERVEYVLTQVPIYDNYFLSMAVTGRFRGDRVPPYLLAENFETLRRNLDRVRVVNGWLGPFLDSLPAATIDKFNLLDIFDWMSPPVFEQTMQSVLRAAAPGATMIYRSGSYQLDPPASILPQVELHTDLARRLLAQDRSATYGSFYILTKRRSGDCRG